MARSDTGTAGDWRPSFEGGALPAVAFLLAFATWIVVSNGLLTAILGSEPPVLGGVALGTVSSTVQVGLVALVLRREGVRIRDLGLSKRLFVPAIVGAIAVVLAVNAYVAGLLVAGGHDLAVEFFAVFRGPPRNYSILEVLASAVYYYCFVGVAEELAFRGYFQNKLKSLLDGVDDRLARTVAVVGAAVSFALLHVPTILLTENASLGGAVGLLVLISLSGITFGTVYEFTGNLYLVALLHGFGDFWALFVDPGPVAWPNYLVLVLFYAALVLAYRHWASDPPESTPAAIRAD